MRHCRSRVSSAALVLLLVVLQASQTRARDDIGVPLHPKAIPSSIVRQSGKGEGTNWLIVRFRASAPYAEVVKFYKQKAGRQVQISESESDKLVNTLILLVKSPENQINISISTEVGKKKQVTEVELIRNYVSP